MTSLVSDAVSHLHIHDPMLSTVIREYPKPTLIAHTNYYQALVTSIISQQLSVKAAASIEKRFLELFNHSDFPSPEEILGKDVEALRGVGLSYRKAAYIQDLAMKVLDGTIQFDSFAVLSNDAIVKELTLVKGIGVWTVHMFLMFCMGRLDVLPIGDLGIKNGIKKLYNLDYMPTPEDITRIAQEHHWHPYESVASWYVWQSLDNKPII